MENFADKLIKAVQAKGNPICVGLDPRLDQIPAFLIEEARAGGSKQPTTIAADAILAFNKEIIDYVCDIVPVVKPQIAFYEIFGFEGIRAYEETLKYAKQKGLLTIADAKRNDIGSTAAAYAQAFLGEMTFFEGEDEVVMPIFDADSITVNPYLGWDGIKPFAEEADKYGKGVFILDKTSNKSSGDLQDLMTADNVPVYEIMGGFIDSWGANYIGESGYSSIGAVVGATYPEQAKALRKLMPNSIFLVPGYGAQGGGAADVKPCFNDDGLGAIVNSSRGIIFAYRDNHDFGPERFGAAAKAACEAMKADLASVL